jgi:hypothetical protein
MGAVVDEPMKHLVRPKPPWETRDYTHCGRVAGTVPTTSVDALEAHVRRYGKQRTAYTHCMTCLDRLNAYTTIDMRARLRVPITWENKPRAVTARWLEKVRDDAEEDRMRRTLHAIAALVEAHQDEFDAMVAAAGVTDLAAARRERGA